MAEIVLYNVVEGSSCLLEYRGDPGDIVAVTPYVLLEDRVALADRRLLLIKGEPLRFLRDFTFFRTDLTTILLTLTQVLQANVNGIAHLVVPSDGAPAGASIVVQAEVTNFL